MHYFIIISLLFIFSTACQTAKAQELNELKELSDYKGCAFEGKCGIDSDFFKTNLEMAKNGNAKAQLAVSHVYEYESILWLKKSALSGDLSAKEQLADAGFLCRSKLLCFSGGESVLLLKDAIEKGSSSAAIKYGDLISGGPCKAYNLAYCHGDFIYKSQGKEAFEYYKIASDMGSLRGKTKLSGQYNSGENVPKDCTKANRLMLEAAEMGDEIAIWMMTVIYGGHDKYCSDKDPVKEAEMQKKLDALKRK